MGVDIPMGKYDITNISATEQNRFSASECQGFVLGQPLIENSAVVHAVSVSSYCRLCPIRGNRPNCTQCNRFL